MIEFECNFGRRDEDESQLDSITDYTRKLQCGLIPNGDFVEDKETASWQRPAYGMISETHAANYFARRSF